MTLIKLSLLCFTFAVFAAVPIVLADLATLKMDTAKERMSESTTRVKSILKLLTGDVLIPIV